MTLSRSPDAQSVAPRPYPQEQHRLDFECLNSGGPDFGTWIFGEPREHLACEFGARQEVTQSIHNALSNNR